MKKCKKCGETKPHTDFNKCATNRDRLRGSCKDCGKKSSKAYYDKNKIELYEKAKLWKLENKEKLLEIHRNWRKNNPEKCKEIWNRHKVKPERKLYEKNYRNENREKLQAKRLKKFKETPQLQWVYKLRSLAHSAIRQRLSLKDRFCMEFNCTFKVFIKHLENTFKEGMTWENYGKVWHVDHIRPLSSFDLEVLEHRFKAAHYSNHQALFVFENLSKADKL